ncbi:peptidase S33, proline iminopeptidase 1 [Piromyces finnis]|uniref:Proline iminopeptidase n=1 Tax=Piromyces finnis TaxID=1754191 RepID=A0A1Y1UWC3_9FUNG|nr:peptidase S33, proline iminopeptidase 1 [Piromyces finnis]|eukprot:ORX41916.1 peptidase S33, proline iminopeptidase 1 [Piromyces finnis]
MVVKQNQDDLLYPEIEAYDTGFLKVSNIHNIYYEQSGNPNGNPVIYVHGGPGGGTFPKDRRYFDPKTYRIILFDQRGCGNSTPAACLEQNTTWDLVSDIEKLRQHLNIDKWLVFGGSWGSTLSLAYSEKYPEHVKGLILRGIFLGRDSELNWLYQGGSAHLFPDYWEGYIEPIPENERDNFIVAYYKRLTSNNEEEKLKCAKAWTKWEEATSKLYIDEDQFFINKSEDSAKFAAAFARIECHYFINKCFFDSQNYLLENIEKIRNIPGIIIQGRYDCVCPATTAWDLHKKWPEAEFHIVPDCGHSVSEYGITKKIMEATNKFKNI